MNRTLSLILFVTMQGCTNNSTNPAGTSQVTNTSHYIIVLKEPVVGILSNVSNNDQILSTINLLKIPQSAIGHIYGEALYGFSADLTTDQLEKLSKDSHIDFIEKDQLISLNDKIVSKSSSEQILAQTTPWGITRVGGQSKATTFGKAWIVDTGINLDHPDLNVYTSKCTTFVRTGQDALSAEDYNGHGSHVSGTIAAKNNSIGVVGVAPNAYLVAVKVMDKNGNGYISDIVAGLDYVYKNASKGDVVNCSFGGGSSTALDNAVSQFGIRNSSGGTYVYVTIAAGNSADKAGNYSPGRVSGSGIFTVSAFDEYDKFAAWSNYGNPPVDFAAPGVDVISTYKTKGYATLSGTSMSAPHVAGIILARLASGVAGTPATNGYVKNSPDKGSYPIAHE